MTKLLSEFGLKIYIARLGDAVSDSLEQQCHALMPPAILSSILRYRRWQDRQATLFGKLLLLEALQEEFHEAGRGKFQSLDATRHGKPFIPGGPDFNISHAGEMVVLAVAQNGAVGVDIEKIRPVNLEDYSQYLPEVAHLNEKYAVCEVNRRFFDCWTQKEAVLKGSGKGLLAPLEQVSLRGGTALFYESTWFIKKLPIEEGYCCHVATENKLGKVAFKWVDLGSCSQGGRNQSEHPGDLDRNRGAT